MINLKRSSGLPCIQFVLLFWHWLSVVKNEAATSAAAAAASAETERQFIWFSDIHLDPYYGTDRATQYSAYNDDQECGTGKKVTHPYGDYGCDAPPLLVESLIQRAAARYCGTTSDNNNNNNSTTSKVDFVMITGDFTRHHNDELLPNPLNATEDIIRTVSQTLTASFPANLPILPNLGNNDVTPDYYLDYNNPSEMLNMAFRGFKPLFVASAFGENATTTFVRGGYYAYQLEEAPSGLTILSLNTVLYATNHIPNNNDNDKPDDPLGQFAWLEEELVQATQEQRSVYIIGHIPPSIGSYRHTQLWQEQYLETYYTIVDAYKKVVKAQLFGHIHSDEFRIHRHVFPMYLTSSFTPIYGSNPSFRVVTYDSETMALLDYTTEYLDLDVATATAYQNTMESNNNGNATTTQTYVLEENAHYWKQGQSFTKAFQVPDMSLRSLETIVHDLQMSTDDSVYWEALLTRWHVYTHGSEVCDIVCRREWVCTLTSVTAEQYQTCVMELWLEEDALAIFGVVLVVLLSVFVVGYLGCRYGPQCDCRRRHSYEVPSDHHDGFGPIENRPGGEQQLLEIT